MPFGNFCAFPRASAILPQRSRHPKLESMLHLPPRTGSDAGGCLATLELHLSGLSPSDRGGRLHLAEPRAYSQGVETRWHHTLSHTHEKKKGTAKNISSHFPLRSYNLFLLWHKNLNYGQFIFVKEKVHRWLWNTWWTILKNLEKTYLKPFKC